MRARMDSLDMLANNVANSGTVGFKADREFYGVYVSEQAAQNIDPDLSPVVEKHWTDFSQGTLLASGNPLDLAVSGTGLFALDSPTGPLYTRNGNFRLSPDGQIISQDGSKLRVKTPNNQPLKLDPARAVDIGPDGMIRQDSQELGQIETFEMDNTNALEKRGSSYFQWMDNGLPKTSTSTEIHQGVVENSNVPVAEAAVRLVSVMRQFEMLQKAISLGADMNRRSIEEVAKVN